MVEMKQNKDYKVLFSNNTESVCEITHRTDLSEEEFVESPLCTNQHEGRQLLKEVYPFHVDQLFTYIFTKSEFMSNFFASRNVVNITQDEWMHNKENQTDTRTINLTVPLNASIGPKSTRVIETQTLLACSKAGHLYAIDTEIVNLDIPYSAHFYLYAHICIQRFSDTQSSMSITAQIKYKKSVWGFVKSIIEKNCWQGLEDTYTSLSKALHNEGNKIKNCTSKHKYKKRKNSKHQLYETTDVKPRKDQCKRVFPNINIKYPVVIFFILLLMLLTLNIVLYFKLLSLEEYSPSLTPNSENDQPRSEWENFFEKHETWNSDEMQHFQNILKTTIKLLYDTEISMNELKKSMPA